MKSFKSLKVAFSLAIIAALTGCDEDNPIVKEKGTQQDVVLTQQEFFELNRNTESGIDNFSNAQTITFSELKRVIDQRPLDGNRENTYDFQNGLLILNTYDGQPQRISSAVPISALSIEGQARAAEMFKKLPSSNSPSPPISLRINN